MEHKMDHLACFVAGMFALEAINEVDEMRRKVALTLAEEIANTCHESYIRTGKHVIFICCCLVIILLPIFLLSLYIH